jgi:hypothetical protein
MRSLDPNDASGITQSIEKTVKEALDGEQKRVLDAFSLNNDQGVLTRVVAQLESTNGKLKGDIERQIQVAMQEFSLDDEKSALSRLVRKVEETTNQITDEFSVDNRDSAINKLNLVLSETRQSINDNLTLDNEQSALARLNRQLTNVLDDVRTKNQQFQEDVSAKLASLVTRHQEEMRSTTHGINFEEEFRAFVQREAQKAGDIFEPTGTKPGAIPKCKTGDAVIEVGAEAAAARERIVLEAKGNKSYRLEDAREEIEKARKNRNASIGIFVFAKGSAPGGMVPFARIDQDLFVTWDASDPSTDIYLTAAISVGNALLFRQKLADSRGHGDIAGIESAVNILERQLKGLDDMETWTTTVQSNSGKILREILKIRDIADEQLQQLRACLDALKAVE